MYTLYSRDPTGWYFRSISSVERPPRARAAAGAEHARAGRDAGVRAVGQQEKLFVGMILILIFAEALGLYGLIVALILSQQSAECTA